MMNLFKNREPTLRDCIAGAVVSLIACVVAVMLGDVLFATFSLGMSVGCMGCAYGEKIHS